MSGLDPRLIERRMIESTRLLEQAQHRKVQLSRERYYVELTEKELEKPSPALYRTVGKVFLSMTPEEATEDVKSKLKMIDEEIANTERQEKQFKESRDKADADFHAFTAYMKRMQGQK